ncbi:MAG: aminotransferase class III-fold pyridoxal phosphate-dependent enzyme [Gammaproteobacteria bacterium]|nr:aminotransferase class III-fold pyridoxal phosphate-dependent enzyme [Gammaproteobacteria bacterium]
MNAAIAAQLERYSTSRRSFSAGHPGVRYTERLTSLFPEPLNHVFLTNSGSEAVDTALKVALAYSQGRWRGVQRFVSLAERRDTTAWDSAVCPSVDSSKIARPSAPCCPARRSYSPYARYRAQRVLPGLPQHRR